MAEHKRHMDVLERVRESGIQSQHCNWVADWKEQSRFDEMYI